MQIPLCEILGLELVNRRREGMKGVLNFSESTIEAAEQDRPGTWPGRPEIRLLNYSGN